jgi:protein-tyrosine kinase
MSLVESAMAKAKARELADGSTRAPQGSRAPYARTPGSTSPQRDVKDRIAPHARVADVKVCQLSRVLLDESSDENAAAVAAYRMLRTRILHRARSKNWSTIGVTSAGPGDGKSLTALNLSLSLAREGNSEVVLLDLDMRKPSICRYLGVIPPAQIQGFFEQQVDLSELFFSIGVENLLIASGTESTARASEMLASAKFDELIEYIKGRTTNPIVLIDLPPLLITDDALVIVPKIDAMLLVASEGSTDRAVFKKAVEILAEFPIAGVVLNRAVDTGENYSYGYGTGDN